MAALTQDLRFALRMLVRNPGFTVVSLVTLALGIGASTAMFSVINAVLLRPLPYEDAGRLVLMWETSPELPSMSVAYPDFVDWREQNEAFEGVAAYNRFHNMNLTGTEVPERLATALVSASLFDILHVKPALGRVFTDEEDRHGAEPVVVLGHELWERRFASDPDVVGRLVTLDGRGYTVVGVLPRGFAFPSGVEVWAPLAQFEDEGMLHRGNHPGLYVLGRLAPGVELERARSEMETIGLRLEEAYPETNTGVRASLVPLREIMVRGIRPTLLVLFGAVGFVLLIACANMANLLLARGASRREEIAVRAALGAGRGRLVRQLLTEGLVFALIAAALGLALASWGIDLLLALQGGSGPQDVSVTSDLRVLGFAFLASLLTTLLFGLLPALQASRPGALREAGHGMAAQRQRLRAALVVGEVALSLMLLIGAGLMMKSFLRLVQVDPGFNASNLLTMQLSLPDQGYADGPALARFHADVVEQMHAIPGVAYAAAVNPLPFGPGGWQAGITVEGLPDPGPAGNPSVETAAVTTDYFRTMEIPLLKGRMFSEADDHRAGPVVVVSNAMVQRFWPDEDPMGKRLKFGPFTSERPWMSVVGVVQDVKHWTLEASGSAEIYVPYRQHPENMRGVSVVLRSTLEPGSLATAARNAVLAVDPNQPVYRIQTMEEMVATSTSDRRFAIALMGTFAGVALFLALAGIYGVMAYLAARRTHEFGLRMALGASPPDILRLMVGQGMKLAAIGLVLGVAGALALNRVLAGMLFQVSSTDPLTFAGISALMVAVVALASYIPALRAARVDPMVALRYE